MVAVRPLFRYDVRRGPSAGPGSDGNARGLLKLTHVRVTKYRCIEDSTEVSIEPDVTALMGRNESGKTCFLEALRRLNAVDGSRFEITADYPRAQLGAYRRRHTRSPDTAISARLELDDSEVREVEKRFGKGILRSRSVVVKRDYKNVLSAELPVSESLVIRQIVQKRSDLDEGARAAALGAETFQALATALAPYIDKSPGAAVIAQVARHLEGSPLQTRIWAETLQARMPRFISFGEEDVMPGAIALTSLLDPTMRNAPGVSTVLALLELSGVEPAELDPQDQSYEELVARIETAAMAITDELVTWWSGDKDLEVAIDVANAGANDPGFARGTPVLRIRIGNRKKRTSLPLGERSRGFAWFFSFLVRLCQLGESNTPLVILLDEPGLSLHAGMQGDFLRFVEERLGPLHQVIYTTHSPFMLDVARLERARAVTLSPTRGTLVSADLSAVESSTLMPLRAALGAALVEGMLPHRGGATLVVREASDLIWLRAMSMETQRRKKSALDPRFEIVPLGAGASLVPFALLTARPDRRLVLLREGDEAISASNTAIPGLGIVSLASFLGANAAKKDATIEDLVELPLWLSLVTEAHKLSPPMSEDELGSEGAIIQRTHKGLEGSGETLDRLRVAEVAIRRAGSALPPAMVDRFARLFEALNAHIAQMSEQRSVASDPRPRRGA